MMNSHPLITARTSSFVGSDTSSRESTEPIIRLKVDKPSHWAWELTTSADTLPVIQLLDKDGRLLVETTGRTAQRARGSFRDGLKSFEEFPSRPSSTINTILSREDRSSRTSSSVSSAPTALPQGNRNIDGFSTKFGTCDFGYRPRKSRSDVSVGVKTRREPKTRNKRHSSGLEPTYGQSEENAEKKKIPKRYSTGDYLRQQILDDLRSRNSDGRSPEDLARDRCRKVKAYLRSQSDLGELAALESPAKQRGDVSSADARDGRQDGSSGINASCEGNRLAMYSRDRSPEDARDRTLKKYQRCQTEQLPRDKPGKCLEKRTKSMTRQDVASREKYEGSSGQDSFSRGKFSEENGERSSVVEDDDQFEFKKRRICLRTQSDNVSREDAGWGVVEKQDSVKNEELERIKAFLREKIGEKMNRESRNCLANVGIQKRYSDIKEDGRENYRTRKVRSETNIVRFNPEEKFYGQDESAGLQRRSSSRQRIYRPTRSDAVLENPGGKQQTTKRNSSGSERRKFYRKTKSDLLLGQIGSSLESEQDFGNPPRRIRSQDNVERSWREYKERKRHERLQRDSERDVDEEDFMSKPRWKDLQLCPARNCKVCQNLEDSFDYVATGRSSRSDETARGELDSLGEKWDEGKKEDKVSDSMECCESAESRPGTSLQENYLLLDAKVPEDANICRLQASVKTNLTTDLKSPDFGYNSMQKSLFRDYKELCARSNVKKSDTFKIVDGSEDPEECHEDGYIDDSSKDLASLSNKSNEDIAKDYFKRVYELLRKRQEEARRVAEGTGEPACEDSSSSNYVEEVQRKRPRRRRKDKGAEGEEVITVPPTVAGQDGWKSQQQQERLANDLPGENRKGYRSRLQSVSGNRRARPAPPPPPPPPISAKVNAKDISKYFDHQPNKENTPGNARGPETLNEREPSTTTGKNYRVADAMGSNLSRHNGKGLTGRRTQSSGNLCDPKGKLNSVGKILVPCSTAHRQRYKFCGSLPNHLDDKDVMDDESRENNNVMSDTMTGNLGGTLPHKKRSLGVHFSDSGPTGALDLVKHRSQDSLDENDPWRYHQSDLDLVRCRHGNFDSVRRNRSVDTVAGDSGRRYTRVTSSENRCQRNTELDLVGTLPKRKQESRASGKSLETLSTSQHSAAKEPSADRDEELLMKVFHKPDCELVKRRQPAKCVDLKFGKITGGEPQDQGYASERSPEDEHPPSLPGQPFPSVTPESTFRVTLQKSSRGLGLSVSGGGTDGPVRVKRLFPQQPAALSNKLQVGDILLAANGIPLTGLTNYEALEVLRTTSSTVELVVCRLPGDTNVTPPGSPPPPPARREPPPPLRILNPLPPLQIEPCGEFDIEMTKVGGSLGFTLRKADSSALGHYVRALVREPALSDGRIRPGDKIVAVDGAPLSPMSHEEAVALLRQCGPKVKLRLYRDLAQTPVSALSPTEPDHPLRPPRTSLRQEAVDMLCDLAVRKLSPGTSSGSSCRQSSSTSCNSPRRIRRLATRTPVSDNDQDSTEKLYEVQTTSTGSQVETSDSDQCSIKTQITNSQPNTPATDIIDPPALYDECDSSSRTSTVARPSFLDLSAPQDKPHFQFSLEADREERTGRAKSRKSSSLDVNVGYERRDTGQGLSSDEQDNDLPSEPASMPPLLSANAQSAAGTGGFSYKNPAYQSANPACGAIEVAAKSKATHSSDQDIPGKVLGTEDPAGTKGLLKWKGVMFAPDDELKQTEKNDDKTEGKAEETAVSAVADPEQGNEVFMVELTRGWNSRLGFSLQPEGNRTVISVVHPDSVAAKDGRLKQGDVLLMVNDESVENMSTADIIDLLRKIRGSIGITVMRRCCNRDNPT